MSDYAFSDKDLELFAIFSEDMLKVSSKRVVGGVAKDQIAHIGAAEGGVALAGVVVDVASQDRATIDEAQEVDGVRSDVTAKDVQVVEE